VTVRLLARSRWEGVEGCQNVRARSTRHQVVRDEWTGRTNLESLLGFATYPQQCLRSRRLDS
jgi:hypothetical protein